MTTTLADCRTAVTAAPSPVPLPVPPPVTPSTPDKSNVSRVVASPSGSGTRKKQQSGWSVEIQSKSSDDSSSSSDEEDGDTGKHISSATKQVRLIDEKHE